MPKTELQQIKKANHIWNNPWLYTDKEYGKAWRYLSYINKKYGTTDVYTIQSLTK